MSKRKNQPPPIQHHLSNEEFESLQTRIEKNELTEQDKKIALGLLAFNKWMYERLDRAKLSIKRLRQLFGFKKESCDKKETSDDAQNNKPNINGDDNTSTDTNADISEPDASSGTDTTTPNNNATSFPN